MAWPASVLGATSRGHQAVQGKAAVATAQQAGTRAFPPQKGRAIQGFQSPSTKEESLNHMGFFIIIQGVFL